MARDPGRERVEAGPDPRHGDAARHGRRYRAYLSGTGSAAAIRGHPLHPMIVPLPIGALVVAFGFDIAFFMTQDPFFARAAMILLGVGLATGALAAVLGLMEMMSLSRARTLGIAWMHGVGNLVAIFLTLANFLIRHPDPAGGVVPAGVAISGVVLLLLLVGGWLGGEMTYRHGVGVSPGVGSEREAADTDHLPDGRPDIGKS